MVKEHFNTLFICKLKLKLIKSCMEGIEGNDMYRLYQYQRLSYWEKVSRVRSLFSFVFVFEIMLNVVVDKVLLF